jgi:cyclophilin family peptidyl-prolyl cis-trans isomerase
VGTAKRERKKANRQLRLEELEKLRRKQKVRRRGIQFAVIIPLGVLALIGLILLLNKNDNKSTSGTTAPGTDVTDTSPDTTDIQVTAAPTTTIAPSPCPKDDGTATKTTVFPSPPAMCIDITKVYEAKFATNKGTFTMELDPGIAPNTVNNFIFLARYHFFDGTKCHYIQPGFMVRCGDPTGTGTVSGGPGYTFADELPAAGAYQLGSVAMAGAGVDANGSQFFIVTGDQGTKLGPVYSLFGKVTQGFDDTVKAMEKAGSASGKPSEDVIIQTVTISVKAGATATPTTTSTIAPSTTAPGADQSTTTVPTATT